MLNDKAQNNENARNALLRSIAEYRFAALETALYLDTHPNDVNTLRRHNDFCETLKSLCAEYHSTFNDPLSVYESSVGSWTYIERWPVGLGCNTCYGGDK